MAKYKNASYSLLRFLLKKLAHSEQVFLLPIQKTGEMPTIKVIRYFIRNKVISGLANVWTWKTISIYWKYNGKMVFLPYISEDKMKNRRFWFIVERLKTQTKNIYSTHSKLECLEIIMVQMKDRILFFLFAYSKLEVTILPAFVIS